jgi:hypothetical protein
VLSEDEVGGTLDEALAEEVLALVGEECVLVSVETDTVVALRGAVAAQGDCLGSLAVGVLDVDVVELGVGGVVRDGSWWGLALLTAVSKRKCNLPVPSLLVPQLVWLQDCWTFTLLPE